jgi:hypothetical protein
MEKDFVFAPASVERNLRKEAERFQHDPKRKGELAELAFILKAASLGLIVSKPYGDSFPYDLIVEKDGHLLKIQVKSSFGSKHRGFTVSSVKSGGPCAKGYTPTEIDFLAAYIAPHDTWYILPVQAIKGFKSLRLYPIPSKKKDGGRYEIYREAWYLISAPPGTAPPALDRDPPSETSGDP